MKIELKKDDPALKDITIELKPGFYQDPSQYGLAEYITVLQLVEFYERWVRVVGSVKAFASMKDYAESLLNDLKELSSFCGKDPEDY